MPHTIETTAYKFDELTDKAKENARDWWRRCEDQDNYFSESVYEDVATIAELFGLDIRQRPYKCMDGKTRYNPAIFFSGFWSQGDGACFEGEYRYKKGALKAVKDYAPQDKDLHDIVESLQCAQAGNFYQVSCTMKHSGHYYHSGCMSVDCERIDDRYYSVLDEDTFIQVMREFADWIYDRLESEYDYIMADENVDENIRANEYNFTEGGELI
jgi:hypothetical protein